jgi:hypothetical protein
MIRSRRSTRRWMSLIAVLAALFVAVPLHPATTGTGGRIGERHGTLSAADGNHIYDWQLDQMIKKLMGVNYQSRIFCFTECYGGDKIDDFAGDRNTTILTGGAPGKVTYYGGYDRGLAQGLRPGSTTSAAHQAGLAHQKLLESPTATGPNQDIGTGGAGGAIKSCHVLVWAGKPDSPDWDDINDIRANFAGQPNTTVTVLAGDGTNADGAANLQQLVTALSHIGALMSPDEQFILFVTDHGNLDASLRDTVILSGGHTDLLLGINPQIYHDMTVDPGNDPFLALFSQYGAPPIAAGTLSVSFNHLGPFSVGSTLQTIPLDYDGDGTIDQYEYMAPIPESAIVSGDNAVHLVNTGTTDQSLMFVSLDTGAIRRPDAAVTP